MSNKLRWHGSAAAFAAILGVCRRGGPGSQLSALQRAPGKYLVWRPGRNVAFAQMLLVMPRDR